jgi:hypothetical protein
LPLSNRHIAQLEARNGLDILAIAAVGRAAIEAARRGVPVSAVDALIETGRLTLAEIDRIVLPRKTLSHRRALGALTPDQSDRVIWVARWDRGGGGDSRVRRERRPLAAPADDGARRRQADRSARHFGGRPAGRAPPDEDLSGEGARLVGGRWNSPGRPVVTTAEDAALAVLEVRVHLDLDFSLLPADDVLIAIDLDELSAGRLDVFPADTVAFGDAWLASRRSPVLNVPSAISPRAATCLSTPPTPTPGGRGSLRSGAFRSTSGYGAREPAN